VNIKNELIELKKYIHFSTVLGRYLQGRQFSRRIYDVKNMGAYPYISVNLISVNPVIFYLLTI
jgi:hypothetical protein